MSMSHPLGGLPTWAGMPSPTPQTHDDEKGTELQGVQNGKPLWKSPGAADAAAGGEAAAGGAAEAVDLLPMMAL